MKTNIVFKTGSWFFVLIGLSEILSLLFPYITINLNSITHNPSQLGKVLSIGKFLLQLPGWLGFVILILGFYRYEDD